MKAIRNKYTCVSSWLHNHTNKNSFNCQKKKRGRQDAQAPGMGLQITIKSDEFTLEHWSDMVMLGLWSFRSQSAQPHTQQSGEPSLFCFLLRLENLLRDSRRPSRCRQCRCWVERMKPSKSCHGTTTCLHPIIPQTTSLQNGPYCAYKLIFSSSFCVFFSEGIIDNFGRTVVCQGGLTTA